ncbi:GNAT family N-acetyltransferase [Aromatoleum petrolei]|uniref:GNAT family N-acetyltransferase n=3 Tax=Aromatoleum petrolei TaxID=76116 RepID=A0ABX1MQ32_9RHOO|nr:GNAT family N-acetyltransferase [Aromatoleum petrolei]
MRILIDLVAQRLSLFGADGACIRRYSVSTALNGAGEVRDSGCTPRGRHCIRAKIGAGAAKATVFRGRRPTGEIWTPELAAANPGRDWILSRILWLSGCEPGRNRLGKLDSMRRYIYIHGTPDDQPMGEPRSHGCIRMRNDDVIELFDLVQAGTEVDIEERTYMDAGATIRILDWTDAAALAMPLREQVFVREQGVPAELERDARDPHCRHALATTAAGQVVGTGRLLPDGHIGRMAVAAPWRKRGIGGLMLEALVTEAVRLGFTEVVLNAQIDAVDFYLRHGFAPQGETFIEAGIRHQTMRRSLVPKHA